MSTESPLDASTVVVNERRRLINFRLLGAYLAAGWQTDYGQANYPHLAVVWVHGCAPVVPEGEP